MELAGFVLIAAAVIAGAAVLARRSPVHDPAQAQALQGLAQGVVRLQSILTVGLEARRGPAGVEDEIEVPYFVAIVDPAQRILAKQVFPTTLVFAESGIQAQRFDEVEQNFRVAPGYFGADYSILIGLQLDREQFDENLKRERR